MRGIVVILMSLVSLGLMGSYYVERIYMPDCLYEMMQMVDQEVLISEFVPKDYQSIVAVLKDTDEFKKILDDYMKAFSYYLSDGSTTYQIPKESQETLYRLYSDYFISQYPQFQFLPTDLFVSFLVEHMDLNHYLPSFSQLKQQIPSIIFRIKDVWMSPKVRYLLWSGLILLLIFDFFYYRSLYAVAWMFLIDGIVIMVVMNMDISTAYGWINPCINYVIHQLNDVVKFCIIGAMGCLIVEWGKNYVQKIFLF